MVKTTKRTRLQQSFVINKGLYLFLAALVAFLALAAVQPVRAAEAPADTKPPLIALNASTLTPTSGNVTVTVSVDGTGSSVSLVKWSFGTYNLADYPSGAAWQDATPAAGTGNYTFTAAQNGTYTVFARDSAGNGAVDQILVNNIFTPAGAVAVTLGSATGTSAGTVDVPVNMALPEQEIGSFSIQVDFDKEALEAVGVTAGPDATGLQWYAQNNTSWVRTTWVMKPFENVPAMGKAGTLCTLQFKIKSGATPGDKPLTVVTGNNANFSLTNSNGMEMNKTFTPGKVTVSSLAIATASLPNGTAGTPYSAALTATGGTAPYTWSAIGLPQGLGMNTSSGVISGTPGAAGTATITAAVSDSSGLSASLNLSLTINQAGLAIATTSLPNGMVGIPYSAALTATNGTAPYTWSAGGLPQGLSVNASSGVISGAPVTAGISTVTATVSDSDGRSASVNFSLTINQAGLAIATTSLPNGTAETPYSATLTALGGTAPYTWSAGGLPQGLVISFSGVISGTPGTTGTSTVAAAVYDSNGGHAGVNLSLIVTGSSGGGGGGGGGGTPATTTTTAATTTTSQNNGTQTVMAVMVNGQTQEHSATATTIKEGDKNVTTVTVDQKKLDEKLNKEGDNSVLTIPVNTKADVVVSELNGQMVKNMENKHSVVEIKTEAASYALPAQQINIDAVSEQFGKSVELKDIMVKIEISKSSNETARVVENSAKNGEYTIVAPPVDFKVTCTFENKTVEVNRFNNYVERTIAIPDGVDPAKVTTGVVLNSDGTLTHVPTKVVLIDGKYYAKLNSLTNSTYSVIWHPKTFKDVESHWAKGYVNEMGSRLVINGVDENNFAPDRDITRAEFVAITGRALGLKAGGTADKFSDVKESDWFSGAVRTANEYGIISGYGDGTFKPEKAITREEAFVMIARAMKIAGMDINISDTDADAQLAGFTDKDGVETWARKSAAACVKNGIAAGNNGLLAPEANITRAETATIIIRTLQKANLI